MITQELIHQLFDYSPVTGLFYWKNNQGKIHSGSKAGSSRKDKYIVIGINSKLYLAHRLAWLYVYGELPKFIDHINGDPSDNRLCNLRSCSHTKNMRNRKLQVNNSTGTSGVYWDNRRNKWVAMLWDKGKDKFLGYFIKIEDAISARKEAELKYFEGFHRETSKR